MLCEWFQFQVRIHFFHLVLFKINLMNCESKFKREVWDFEKNKYTYSPTVGGCSVGLMPHLSPAASKIKN